MKTRIAFYAILACISNTLYSQNFKGKIISEEQTPISNATIYFGENQKRVYPNQVGEFELNLQSRMPIRIQSKDFETLYDTLEISETAKTFSLLIPKNEIEEIQVKAIRAGNNTPTTYSNLSKEDIRKSNFGQDLPYLLDGTLSTVVSSDAGAGVGYTNIRIRGVDPTRTNVTINGIPINDAESHGMFWVNMPDFASSTENIQIQRGVGTSSNGGAAFGASINVKSDQIAKKAYAELDNSVGSFNTIKNTVKVGTGVINNHFAFDARLSNILSKGYIDRSSSDLKSYFASGTWFNAKSSLKLVVFGGKQTTYQAWNGIPESRLRNDQAGMLAYADRNWFSAEETSNLLNSGRTYNYFTYKNQVDHYNQTHYQLHFNHRFTPHLKFNASAHYTRGKGYYEEYKADAKLSNYGMNPIQIENTTITNTDLIRRKWLDNHFYGIVYNLNYSKNNLELIYGGGINNYQGDHFGTVIWARHASNTEINHQYYADDAQKIDFNNFIKVNYTLGKNVLFGDFQVRSINYIFEGFSDLDDSQGTISQQKANYIFMNPKIGWMYKWNQQQSTYASIAIANREPIRKDFTENSSGNRPQAERLYNLEIGHRILKNKWSFNANYFMMYYDNQLILTGQINDVGGYTRTNAKSSYRSGIELEGGYQITNWLLAQAGFSYSLNKIKAFTEYVDDYDNGGQIAIEHKNTDLAFSPNLITSGALTFQPVKGLSIRLTGKYVGRQYLDNTSDMARSIEGYFLMNGFINYTLNVKGIQGIDFGLMVNNILNKKYENNGYTYSYLLNQQLIKENFYFPQAGTNFMLRVAVRI